MSKKLHFRPVITPWIIWLAFLGVILLGGLIAGILVFWKGLSITHLTDLVPWGLWITIDLSSIALAAGAFSLCAGVYLFGLKRYQPIARTATFVGLIGYTMAMLALVLDIGRPDRFWHALVYWNEHSLLWEVTMCVMLYLTVLVFESMPIFANFEWLRKRLPKVAAMMERVHHYAPILAIIGLGLSSLHQSSLGATYGVIKARPFWFKPEMSVLFMLSAIVGGISLTLFASMFASGLTGKAKLNDALIERVAHFVGYLLIGYFYFRAWDALSVTYTYDPGRSEGLHFLTKGPLVFNFWVVELLLGMIVPMILLLYRPTRINRFWRMVALLLVAAGVVAFRWDTNITGLLVVMPYVPGQAIAYTSYRPSLIEIMTGAAIIAYGLAAFSLGVKYLRVVDHSLIEEEHAKVKVEAAEPVTI
ncbi:MAG TPA: NrfD/PsrC family molybdoenzyme membrane anchor subunit [Anaerolineales bacterium]|nr:NrfD/PsrC family molybdoenzyme membrane anchor subunit [Anaerolineales bacterium]